MNYKIYAPTYKRSKLCNTHNYLKEVIYVVRESEAEDYKDVHDKLWIVPDSAQGNIARIRNYILDNAKEDNIIMMDDDIKYFGRWNDSDSQRLTEQEVYNMIQEGNQLAEDMDVHFWGINVVADKGAYMQYNPFGMKQFIGGPFHAHRKNPLRYDEVIFLKEDYDMTIQILNKFRKNLRLNMYHYVCDQNTLAGGCAESRNVETEMEHNDMLQKKWGSKIVRFDTRNRSDKNKSYDINPIIKVPIKGV
jgi:hypothetical protein